MHRYFGMIKTLGLIDRAYVVNRDQDVDRMARTAKRLGNVEIPFIRFSAKCFSDADGHQSAGERGNYASHLEIIETAQKEGLSNVLIMEDDVIFRDDFIDLWNQILPKFKDLEYDIFYGYNWRNKGGRADKIGLALIPSTLCTHFYVVHSRFYATFIQIARANQNTRRAHAIDGIITSKIAVLSGVQSSRKGFVVSYCIEGKRESKRV